MLARDPAFKHTNEILVINYTSRQYNTLKISKHMNLPSLQKTVFQQTQSYVTINLQNQMKMGGNSHRQWGKKAIKVCEPWDGEDKWSAWSGFPALGAERGVLSLEW